MSSDDTPSTRAEIEKHNSVYECLCNADCPKQPGPTAAASGPAPA